MFSNHIKEISHNLLYSPQPQEYDTRPAEVSTFIPDVYPELAIELNEYSKTLKYKDNHRLLKNYIDVDFFQFPFVTVLKQNDTIVGFSTGYTRDFYKKNDIRILTRYYQDNENFRIKFTREILRPTTYNVLLQQIEMSQRLKFDNCFISREPRTNQFFIKFVDAINERTDYNWEFREGPYLVAPDPPNPECWQSIAVTNLNNNSTKDFWEYWRTK